MRFLSPSLIFHKPLGSTPLSTSWRYICLRWMLEAADGLAARQAKDKRLAE